jgi:hypothetical protein
MEKEDHWPKGDPRYPPYWQCRHNRNPSFDPDATMKDPHQVAQCKNFSVPFS